MECNGISQHGPRCNSGTEGNILGMGGMELVSMDLDGAVELKGTYLEKVEWNGIGQHV